MKIWTRREVLASFALGGVLSPLITRHARATSSADGEAVNKAVPFAWEGSAADLDTVRHKLQIHGEVKRNDVRSPWAYALIGVIVLKELSDAVFTTACRMREGIEIDARGNKIIIRKDPDLFKGVILIATKEGTSLTECNQLIGSHRLAEILAKAWKSNSDNRK